MSAPEATRETDEPEADDTVDQEPSRIALLLASLRDHFMWIVPLGALASIAVMITHHPWTWWVLLPVIWSAVALVPVDIDHNLLPDVVTYPMAAAMLVTAWVLSSVYDMPAMLWRPVILTVVVSGLLFLLSLAFGLVSGRVGMGMGDIKWSVSLVLALGVLGVNYVITWLLTTMVVGAVGAVVAVVASKAGRKTRLPYGPWMAVGLVVAIVFA